jgi:hypothetical protein
VRLKRGVQNPKSALHASGFYNADPLATTRYNPEAPSAPKAGELFLEARDAALPQAQGCNNQLPVGPPL